jgi:hypothetical protein
MRSMVEGLVGRCVCHNVLDCVGHVIQDNLRGDAKDVDVFPREPSVTPRVPSGPVATPMRFAIYLDGEARARTIEIQNILSGGVLMAKLQSDRPFTQHLPQQDFGQAHRLAQAACARDGLHRPGERPTSPSTMLRMVPLTVPGRNFRLYPAHIRNTPNAGRSGIGALSVAAKASPRTSRVCAGSMMPSSHSRAVACHGLPSSS